MLHRVLSVVALLSLVAGVPLDVSLSRVVQASGSSTTTTGTGIVVLPSGNFVASGTTNGNVAAAGSSNQLFMRCFASDGSTVWTKQVGVTSGTDATLFFSDSDSSGNIYQVGLCTGSWYGGVWAGVGDVCASKYDSAGNYVMSVSAGNAGYQRPNSMAVAPNQGFYIVGVTGSATWLGVAGTGAPWDGFVLSYTAAGQVISLARFGVSGFLTSFSDVAIDSLGALWVVGATSGVYRGMSSAGGQDAVLQKMGSNLAVVFSTLIGGTGVDEG